jgi:hypothetical protein
MVSTSSSEGLAGNIGLTSFRFIPHRVTQGTVGVPLL